MCLTHEHGYIKQSDFITDNQQVEILYPENITGAVSNIFVYERNTTYFKVHYY